MKPIDFILFDGDSAPNQPVYQVTEAMQRDIRILGATCDYQVLSYYYHEGQMVLEIEEDEQDGNPSF
jgi:hypothetical protein